MAFDVSNLSEIIETARELNEYRIDNLPEFVKPCLISSPTFVHESILHETILPDIYSNLYNIYTGYVLTALRLNQVVSGSRTVRDIMSTVSTQSNLKSYEELSTIINNFKNSVSVEASSKPEFIESRGKDKFPTGRIIAVDLSAENEYNEKLNISINMMIQLHTRIVTDAVLEEFISSKTSLAFKKRWLQFKADEITFWKDFVFQFDKLDKLSKALKEDSSGSLGEMLRGHNRSMFQRLLKFATINKSHNIANKIFIVDANKFKKFCHSNGLNIERLSDRQKLFESLFGMFIVLVDPMYNLITIYANSFNSPTQMTYAQCKNNSSSEKVSLVEVMEMFSQNKMPSF